MLGEAKEGIGLVAGDRLLRTLAIGQLLAALSAGATNALLVVLAAEHLLVEPNRYGLLVGAIGVGAALGPALLLKLIPDPRGKVKGVSRHSSSARGRALVAGRGEPDPGNDQEQRSAEVVDRADANGVGKHAADAEAGQTAGLPEQVHQ